MKATKQKQILFLYLFLVSEIEFTTLHLSGRHRAAEQYLWKRQDFNDLPQSMFFIHIRFPLQVGINR